MEDQAAKLKERGFSVECIHSGRDRAAARQACIDYLNGNLQFLFIAPERLRVPGFPEMLAKRKPTLVAIDEAHCISQWGHDFRPDYRMLGQYLPTLRPAVVIAMTATATTAGTGRYRGSVGTGTGVALHPWLPARQPGGGSHRDRALAARLADKRVIAGRIAAAGDCVRPYAGASHQPGERTRIAFPLRRLPRRARRGSPQTRAGTVSVRPYRSDGGDHRVRDGDRQAQHPDSDPYGAT